MKSFAQLFFLGIFLIAINGCRKDQWNDCFQSTGSDITEIRLAGSFTKLKIGENFDIILTQDTALPEEIKITAGKNIIGEIVAKVKNNTLTIENINRCNFVRSYDRKITIEIRVKYLDDIEILSVSNLTCLDTLHFELRNLKLKNYGLGDVNLKLIVGFLDVQTINSGNVYLEGFSNILSCSIEEVTQFDGRKLLCDDVYMDCHTPLDCFINARNKLFARIYNNGNVFYVEQPQFNFELVEQKGKGQLLKL